MLVIGFGEGQTAFHELDVDPDTDSPRKIHDMLKKATLKSADFVTILCIEDDEVVAQFTDGEDYDLTEDAEDDDTDDDEDEDADPDGLHDIDDEEDDDE